MSPELLTAYAARMAASDGGEWTPERARADIARVVLEVAANLSRSPSYRFGYHDRDDVAQQIAVDALSVIAAGRYDATKPLENFLYVHCRRRLLNWKRDEFIRAEAPCGCCDPFQPPPEPCDRWKRWHARNSAKMGLMAPGALPCPAGGAGRERTPADQAERRELEGRVEAAIPAALRPDYLRMLAGARVSKARRERVRAAVRGALGDAVV